MSTLEIALEILKWMKNEVPPLPPNTSPNERELIAEQLSEKLRAALLPYEGLEINENTKETIIATTKETILYFHACLTQTLTESSSSPT